MDSSAISVLHLLDHSLPVQDGYAFRASAIIREQRAMGWTTWQLTSDKQESVASAPEDGVEYLRTSPLPAPLAELPVAGQLATVLTLRRATLAKAQSLKPRLLHAHSPCLTGLAALPVARRLKIPLVYEMRASWEDAAVSAGQTTPGSVRYRLSRALETRVLSQADAVTTICDGLREDIIGRGIPPHKVTVIPNGVDVQRFAGENSAQREALRRRHAPGGELLLGFIGSFFAWEGLELLLRSVSQLEDMLPRFRVVLVGDGPEEQRLKSLAAELNLTGLVDFAGRVRAEDVPGYYAALDLMVYPRLASPLTEKVTPLKPIEAMAARRIVVASDVAGHRELIRAGHNGLLFSAGSVEALARVLVEAVKHPGHSELRENGLRFAHDERTWAATVGRYRGVYNGLLDT